MPDPSHLYTDRYDILRNGQAKSSELSTDRSEMRSFPMPVGRPREFDTEKALELATSLFWRKGYEGTSLSDLTATLGITRPSLYAAFGNKEALFRLVLDRYEARAGRYRSDALKAP